MASILDGSAAKAREELDQFTRMHGDARGRLGGLEVKYAEALGTLLSESRRLAPGAAKFRLAHICRIAGARRTCPAKIRRRRRGLRVPAA